MHAKLLQPCLTLVTLWTVVLQAPLSIGFSRQEYWNGSPSPPLGYLPHPRIKSISPVSTVLPVDSLPTKQVLTIPTK